MVMSPDLQPNKCTKLGHMFEVNFATLTNVRGGKTNHIGSDNQCAINDSPRQDTIASCKMCFMNEVNNDCLPSIEVNQ